MPEMLQFTARSQKLTQDDRGRNVWEVVETPTELAAAETALLLCDVWDAHTSKGAAERLNAMVPRMSISTLRTRRAGVSSIVLRCSRHRT